MTHLSLCSYILLNYYAVSSLVYNNWVTVNNPSLPREIYSGASGYDSYTNTIYLLGGYTNTKTLISYDISNKVFHDFGVSYFNIDVWNWGQWYTQRANQLWLIDVGGLYFNVFNMDTQSLITNYNGITIDRPVDKDGCLASYNNYLLVIGSATKAQIYDIATNTWLPAVPQLQTSRDAAMCAVINDEIYAIAGYLAVNTIEYLDIHDIPNIQNYAWIYMSGTLPRAYRWRTVIYDNQIVILGGCCDRTSDIFTINPITKTLSNAGNLSYAVHSTSPIIANNIFYVFSGRSDNPTSWMYTPTTAVPTNTPTIVPTNTPTIVPTNEPTIVPTNEPTVPTNTPTIVPTNEPTIVPTNEPTTVPTNTPTTATIVPTNTPATVQPKDGMTENSTFGEHKWIIVAVCYIIVPVCGLLIIGCIVIVFWKKRKQNLNIMMMKETNQTIGNGDIDLQTSDYTLDATIKKGENEPGTGQSDIVNTVVNVPEQMHQAIEKVSPDVNSDIDNSNKIDIDNSNKIDIDNKIVNSDESDESDSDILIHC